MMRGRGSESQPTSGWRSPPRERRELRGVAAGVVAGLGAFFLVRNVAAVAWGLPSGLLRGVPLLVLSLTLVYAGYWLLRSDLPCRRIARIAVLSVAGFLVLVAVALWIVGDVGGFAVDRSTLLAIDVGTIGASTGLLAGLAGERERRRLDLDASDASLAAERAEDRFAYFNRVLRHHVLNGLAVIRGQAELVAQDADEALDEVEIICRRSDEMADLVRNVETLGRAFTGDLSRRAVDPLPAIRAAVESVESKHPEAAIRPTLGDGPSVLANDRLHLVFEAVLGVAVEAAEDGRVDVTAGAEGDDLVVSLAFDGSLSSEPGSGHGARANGGTDMGRFLAETLLEYFGGGLVVREESDGDVMTVRLPAAG